MDRITIIVPDNMVLINGIGKPVDCAALVASRTHAVQWDGLRGHVEYTNAPYIPGEPTDDYLGNAQIDSVTPYQPYIDAWYAYVPPDPPSLQDIPNPFTEVAAAVLAVRDELHAIPHGFSPEHFGRLQLQVNELADVLVAMLQVMVPEGPHDG